MRLNAIKILCICDDIRGPVLRLLVFMLRSTPIPPVQLQPICVVSAAKNSPTLRTGMLEQSI